MDRRPLKLFLSSFSSFFCILTLLTRSQAKNTWKRGTSLTSIPFIFWDEKISTTLVLFTHFGMNPNSSAFCFYLFPTFSGSFYSITIHHACMSRYLSFCVLVLFWTSFSFSSQCSCSIPSNVEHLFTSSPRCVWLILNLLYMTNTNWTIMFHVRPFNLHVGQHGSDTIKKLRFQ